MSVSPGFEDGLEIDHGHGRRVRDLFDKVLECPAEDRERLLDDMARGSGDGLETIDEVRALLSFVDATRIDEEETEDHDSPDLMVGCRLGEFVLRRLIGFGGTSAVFEAIQDRPNRTVAVKVLRTGIVGPRSRRRFEREVEIAGRLDHPSVARVLGSGSIDVDGRDTPWLAMEFVPESQAITRYAENNKCDLRKRIRLVREAIGGIIAAHRLGVIHRDIKPGNVLVDGAGRVRVIDFGIARLVDTTPNPSRGMMTATIPGQVLGTVPFMAPEQLGGDPEAVDVRTDVYALGVLLHLILTGRLPYEVAGCDFIESARRIRESEVSSLRRLQPAIDRDLDGIVQKALSKEPGSRYQSAEYLDADLESWLDHRPVAARPLGSIGRSWRFARRNPAVTLLGTAAVIGAVATTVVMATMLARESRLRSSADRAAANAGIAAASGAMQQGDLGGMHRYLESVPDSERGWEHRWLSSLVETGNIIIQHDPGDVISVDVLVSSPTRPGMLLATGYRGTWAYKLPEAELLWELPEFSQGGNWKHVVLPDEKGVVVCGLGPRMKVLDLGTGEPLATFDTPGSIGAMWPLDDDEILLGGDDGRLSRMDLADGRIIDQVNVELGGITAMLGLEDGRILLGTMRGHILETDAEFSEILVVRDFGRMIARIRADASQRRIAVCTHGDTVEILDAGTMETVIRLDDHLADVWDARFDDENNRIITVSLDESLRVFDLFTGQTIERRSGPHSYVWSLALEEDARHAWIGCHDGSVRRIELVPSPITIPGDEAALSIAWSPDGRSVSLLTNQGVHRLDLESRRLVAGFSHELSLNDASRGNIVWTQSGIWCGWEGHQGLMKFDPELQEKTEFFDGQQVSGMFPMVDGGIVVGFENGRVLRISPDGKVIAENKFDEILNDFALHPGRGELYCRFRGTGRDGVVVDPETLEAQRSFTGFGDGSTFAMTFSPDGEYVATGGRERPGNVMVFPNQPPWVQGGIRRIGHSGDARFVEFMDGGRRLVSAGDDGRILMARPDDTQPLLTLFESNQAIRGFAVSPDRRSIAATDGRQLFLAVP